MRQVKMANAFHGDLKSIAKSQSVYLRELYDDAIRWFIGFRTSFGNYDQYLISPKEGSYKSMWLTSAMAEQVKRVAADDDVAENRVIYTSLFLYVQHLNHSSRAQEEGTIHQKAVD